MTSKTTKYYHKNSDLLAFERYENSNGYWWESTYDDNCNQLTFKTSNGYWTESTYYNKGNELTYKDSEGCFKIKGKEVTKQEFENFINRPCVGKKVIVDGVEYQLK